jgi:hypothetical protein
MSTHQPFDWRAPARERGVDSWRAIGSIANSLIQKHLAAEQRKRAIEAFVAWRAAHRGAVS